MNRFLDLEYTSGYNQSKTSKLKNNKNSTFVTSQTKVVTNANQVKNWKFLIDAMPSISILDNLRRRNIIIQDIFTFPGGSTINLDFYSVKVIQMPKNISPEELLKMVRLRMGALTAPWVKSWSPISQKDKKVWESDNPLGSVIHLNFLGPDNALVVTINSGSNHWIFATAKHMTHSVGEHPVIGNRYFGYYKDKDGNMIFFTRGADRSAYGVLQRAVFFGGDKNWETFQEKLASIINKIGGKAVVHTKQQNLYKWKDVRKFI